MSTEVVEMGPPATAGGHAQVPVAAPVSSAPVSSPPVSSLPVPRHVRVGARSAGRTWALRLLLAVVVLAVGVAAGLGAMAVRDVVAYRAALDGRILPGATISGIDVGGMTEAEALVAVEATVGPTLEREVVLVHGDDRWPTSPRDLGARDDSAELVAAALAAGPERTLVEMARLRWSDKEIDFARDVAVSSPETARGWVESVAAVANTPPIDASVDYASGWVELRPERDGLAVDVEGSTAAVLDTIASGGTEATLVATSTPATVTAADFRQVLLLRQDERKLYLYEDGEIVREWVVTVGTGSYPTPRGEFYVSLKRHMPTWVNPSPDDWGASMPESIGPGPANPLGVRALNWSTMDGGNTAIRFHGTQAVGQLGQAGSHGCVRLSNDEVVELFDLVDEGAKIVSI